MLLIGAQKRMFLRAWIPVTVVSFYGWLPPTQAMLPLKPIEKNLSRQQGTASTSASIEECAICWDAIDLAQPRSYKELTCDPNRTLVKHRFCAECFSSLRKTYKNCAICRTPIAELQPLIEWDSVTCGAAVIAIVTAKAFFNFYYLQR